MDTKTSKTIKDLPKGAGHRKRLRERFLQSGLDGFLNHHYQNQTIPATAQFLE